MADKLAPYRGKRSAAKTPEPVPELGALPEGNDDTFVIQEHHARRLHWDFRLEHDGVLVSWALPKGMPPEPKRNHLAVHTEDHPLEYASFAGRIPAGEYGAGQVLIWDSGRYVCEKWSDSEIKVVLDGQRVKGRYVLFRTRGDNWMIHRMDPPRDPDWQPMPQLIRPMLATAGTLAATETGPARAYELKWDGLRAVVYAGAGQSRVMTRNDLDVTAAYPELRGLAESLGSAQVVLDGEIVAFDPGTRQISFGTLQQRMHVRNPAQVRRLAQQIPITYLIFDLMYLDGHATTSLPYRQRRQLLESLRLRGTHWETPPVLEGLDGAEALELSRQHGLEGVVAKRLDSTYQPGRRSPTWMKIKNVRTQEVVIGGWAPGKGKRAKTIGALLLGIPGEAGLEYVGQVGTGFTDQTLDELHRALTPLARKTPPFNTGPTAREAEDAHWVSPALVGEVEYAELTKDGRLRHSSWRGLRPDKKPDQVRREATTGEGDHVEAIAPRM